MSKEYNDRWWKPLINKPLTLKEIRDKARVEILKIKKEFDKNKSK